MNKYIKLFEDYTQTLNNEKIIDFFVTALEGGSNSWYYIKNVPNKIREIKKTKNVSFSEAIGYFVLGGGSIEIRDTEDEDEILGVVDMDSLLDAINTMKEKYNTEYQRLLNDEYDANDADIFFQLATMGEVVFG
jgi:hypothetical protein